MTTEATAPTSLPVPGAADAAAPAASSDALEAPEEPATTHTSVRPARGVNGRAAKAAKGALPVSIADIWRAQDVLKIHRADPDDSFAHLQRHDQRQCLSEGRNA